jgi:hypothetical protein
MDGVYRSGFAVELNTTPSGHDAIGLCARLIAQVIRWLRTPVDEFNCANVSDSAKNNSRSVGSSSSRNSTQPRANSDEGLPSAPHC